MSSFTLTKVKTSSYATDEKKLNKSKPLSPPVTKQDCKIYNTILEKVGKITTDRRTGRERKAGKTRYRTNKKVNTKYCPV